MFAMLSTNSMMSTSFVADFLAGLSMGVVIIGVALTLMVLIGWWKIFTKAGEAGVLSIIPIVNFFFMCKIVWGSALYGLVVLIPFIGSIFMIITNFKLGERFGKGLGFGLGLIFIPFIFIPVLGFSDAEYIPVEA